MKNLHPVFQNAVKPFVIPRCGECKEPFTLKEITDRRKGGLDVYDPDTICNECFNSLISQKDESDSPFFCDDSKQI